MIQIHAYKYDRSQKRIFSPKLTKLNTNTKICESIVFDLVTIINDISKLCDSLNQQNTECCELTVISCLF